MEREEREGMEGTERGRILRRSTATEGRGDVGGRVRRREEEVSV